MVPPPAVRLWITEYGHQTRRPAAFGVTAAQQAAYAVRALEIAAANRDVELFVWFVLRDSATTSWRSGLLDLAGRRKPAFARFAAAARPLDAMEPVLAAPAGDGEVEVQVETMALAAHVGTGATVGVTWRAWTGDTLVGVSQAEARIGVDGRVVVPVAFLRKPGATYRVDFEIGDAAGFWVKHSALLLSGAGRSAREPR